MGKVIWLDTRTYMEKLQRGTVTIVIGGGASPSPSSRPSTGESEPLSKPESREGNESSDEE